MVFLHLNAKAVWDSSLFAGIRQKGPRLTCAAKHCKPTRPLPFLRPLGHGTTKAKWQEADFTQCSVPPQSITHHMHAFSNVRIARTWIRLEIVAADLSSLWSLSAVIYLFSRRKAPLLLILRTKYVYEDPKYLYSISWLIR